MAAPSGGVSVSQKSAGGKNTRLGHFNPLQSHFQGIGIGGHFQGPRLGHVAAAHQLAQALVEIEHALNKPNADRVGKLFVLPLDQQVADGRVGPHDLDRRHPGGPLGGELLGRRQELLGDHGLEVELQRLPE